MKKIVTLLLLTFGVSVFAQTATQNTDTLVLSLQDALNIALSESPSIKVAEKEIQRVDYSKQSAWNNILPSLTASGQYGKYLEPASMAMMGQVMNSPTDFNVRASLQLSLPLFAPAVWNSIQMTTLDMKLAVEKAHASKLTLRNDVTKAYYNVLLAQDSHTTLKGGLALAEDVYFQAKKRFEIGLAAEYDVISAEVQMKNLQPNLLEIENGIEQAKMLLKILMGVEISQPLAIKGNLVDFEKDINATNSLKEVSATENTEIKQLDIQQQQLKKALDLQRTQRMPTLAAFGTYGYEGTGNNATEINFGGMPIKVDKSEEWYSQGLMVGLQVSVPLTGIFTNISKEKQIKVQMEQVAIQRDYLTDAIELQIRTALNNMDKAAKQAEAANKNRDLAQKGYNISVKRYETGMGTILELQNASLSLTQSQLVYGQAIASYLSSKADLEKLLGEVN